jgi:hypothetical protein
LEALDVAQFFLSSMLGETSEAALRSWARLARVGLEFASENQPWSGTTAVEETRQEKPSPRGCFELGFPSDTIGFEQPGRKRRGTAAKLSFESNELYIVSIR